MKGYESKYCVGFINNVKKNFFFGLIDRCDILFKLNNCSKVIKELVKE